MLSVYFIFSLVFLLITVLVWHFPFLHPRLFYSVANKTRKEVKIHKITPATGKEPGDIEMTKVRFGHSHLHPIGQLTHTRRSDGVPDPDGVLKESVRIKIRHYRNIYLNRQDQIAFLPLPKYLLESTRPNHFPSVSSGYFRPSIWWLQSFAFLTCSSWDICSSSCTAGGIGSVSFPSLCLFR